MTIRMLENRVWHRDVVDQFDRLGTRRIGIHPPNMHLDFYRPRAEVRANLLEQEREGLGRGSFGARGDARQQDIFNLERRTSRFGVVSDLRSIGVVLRCRVDPDYSKRSSVEVVDRQYEFRAGVFSVEFGNRGIVRFDVKGRLKITVSCPGLSACRHSLHIRETRCYDGDCEGNEADPDRQVHSCTPKSGGDTSINWRARCSR